MKVTVPGALTVLVVVVPSVIFYYTTGIVPGILVAVVKYGFGERAAEPLYRAFNWIFSLLEDLWFPLVAAALELIQGTAISYTVVDGAGQAHLENSAGCVADRNGRKRPLLWHVLSPPSGPGKVKIVMLNHHCRVDWIYLFSYFARSSMSPTLRIVLKEDLRKIPMMGAAMEQFRFLFLSRSWQADESYLKGMVAYFHRFGLPTTILLFPEGTDLSQSNIARSQEFARKNNLPVLHHVLNPRTTGLVALKDMFGEENVEEIVDCTMGYTYGSRRSRPAEPALIDGSHPRRIHMLIRRYRLDSTSTANVDGLTDTAPGSDNEALKQWVHARFAEKEQLLSRFYKNNPVGFDAHDVRAVLGSHCGVLGYDGGQERAAANAFVNRVVTFGAEIGWLHVAAFVCCWLVYPLYVVTHMKVLLLVGVIGVGGLVQEKMRSASNGLQRPLLLRRVSNDETLFARLTGKAKSSRKQD